MSLDKSVMKLVSSRPLQPPLPQGFVLLEITIFNKGGNVVLPLVSMGLKGRETLLLIFFKYELPVSHAVHVNVSLYLQVALW